MVAVMPAKTTVATMPMRIIRPISISPTAKVVAAAAPAQGNTRPRATLAIRMAIDAGLNPISTAAGMKMLQ